MKKLKFLSIALFIVITPNLHAQDDLDDLFDDGDKDSPLHIGMDLVTLSTGTPNIYIEYRPATSFAIQGGIGFSPFSKVIDLVHMDLVSSADLPIIDTSLSTGLYTSLAGKLYFERFSFSDFDFYYYFDWEHRRYKHQTDFNVFRNKYNAGAGYEFGIFGRFTLDAQFGLLYASDKMTVDESYFDNLSLWDSVNPRGHYLDPFFLESRQRTIFFDLNLSLSFAI